MKRTLLALLLALALCLGTALAEETVTLGQPFPDFTATDTQGNTFTLSEALKDHEAVLVNIWATWCPPCAAEFPALNEVYAQYGDRVAFIALSREEEDTPEIIEAYRQAHGLDFPMGRDEGSALYRYSGGNGIPATMIVDRFGNTAFFQVGSFSNAGQIMRVLDALLGDDYTETAALSEIPRASSTVALPLSAVRAAHLENEGARTVIFRAENTPDPMTAWVIDDDTAHLYFEAGAGDNPGDIVYYDQTTPALLELPALLDAERGVYVYDQRVADPDEDVYYAVGTLIRNDVEAFSEDEGIIWVFLIAGDDHIEDFADLLRGSGYEGVTWEFADPAEAPEPEAPGAYTLRVVDQNGAPVPGVYVNFCTDETCSMKKSNDSGTIVFDGEPDVYHVQLLKVPDGYSFDGDFEMYTDKAYGEWVLRIRKD